MPKIPQHEREIKSKSFRIRQLKVRVTEARVIDRVRIDCRAEREGIELYLGARVERHRGRKRYLGLQIVYFHMDGPGNSMSMAEDLLNGGSRHHAQPTRQN
ncbi:uncharacterized protein LOC106417865 isoform X3 [Brassica napus]|uniref:uncharacterized protein LOC106417865 isoform X3 n=1 Tax=Brassica napus TaxID=3708 RepID=UPI0006AB254E|nr:uncharacterized protein LOC106417865 isoform X3 [Brassica napus]